MEKKLNHTIKIEQTEYFLRGTILYTAEIQNVNYNDICICSAPSGYKATKRAQGVCYPIVLLGKHIRVVYK